MYNNQVPRMEIVLYICLFFVVVLLFFVFISIYVVLVYLYISQINQF